MLSNRKRKASAEKTPETSKSRKLKVSNKLFRSPASLKPNSDAKTKISNLLPEGYDSIILTASTKPEENIEGNEAIYGCVRLPIITREDALMWVKKFEMKTSTSYCPQKSWKNDLKAGLFKRKFVCDYQNPEDAGEADSCKACIIFTIKDAKEIQTNPDYYLRDYPSQVIIQFCHNHNVDPEEHAKHLHPSPELRIIFDKYFANGHSPFSALICHKCDLHSSYGAEFYDVVSNSAICPSYNWCVRDYEKLFGRRFIEPQENELIEKLTEVISQYNTKCSSDCAYFSKDSCDLLSLCTPFMKSVFTSGFAEDLITVRSFCTPKTSPRRHKLTLFLCHTPIGSLPFGVVLTYAEEPAVFCEGIKALLKMLGAPSYSPKTIITDENSLISKCLKKSFPNSQVVFNEFQMLQSVWRILRLVCEDDSEEFQALYNLFSVTLNSGCEEDFKENFDSLVIYAERYPKLANFMKYFKFRANAYVLYARPKVEFNTDVLNYTDSGTIILQDVSIKYRNFFNILQLFDFLTKTYVDHYERKLMKIIEGDLKGFFKTNFYVPLSKISNFTCEKVTDTEFVVTLDGIKFFVNAELDTCTCQVGVHGGSCVHQYIVEKNVGLVPECYTPLDDDMLGVLKAILSYKDSSPEELENSVKPGLESSAGDEVSDFSSPSGSANASDVPQDVENLGPIDEIYLAPSKVTDSFTDDDMNPLALSEFDDSKEDNENFSNDTDEQHNRQCGELQHIPSPVDANNATNPATEKILEDIKSPQLDDEKRSLNEADFEVEESVVISDGCNIPDNILETSLDDPVEDIQIYGNVMREDDKKTAEIAEFLTNLPDTNNSHCNALIPDTADATNNLLDELQDSKGNTETLQDSEEPVQEQMPLTEDTEIISDGVVIMKDDEFFTQYKIMEDGVLSIIADTEEEIKFQAASTQNPLENSYEGDNMIMVPPDDLFDNDDYAECTDGSLDKSGSRINVLSSVVIKPSLAPDDQEIFIPQAPLNLSTIKHKTLRSVKQSSEPKSNQAESVFMLHNIPESQIIEEQPEAHCDSELNISSELTGEDPHCRDDAVIENDVIQLYCNQSESEVPLNIEFEYETFDEQAIGEVTNGSVADEVTVKTELTEDVNLPDCDPEQLATENIIDVIEIDSDDLEELASQEHDTNSPLGLEKALPTSPLKAVTLKGVPTAILKKFSISQSSGAAKPIPLRDFMTQRSSIKKDDINKSGLLDRQINTAFSQLTDLASKNKFPGKCKELDATNIASVFKRLSARGISVKRGTDANIKTDVKAKVTGDTSVTKGSTSEEMGRPNTGKWKYEVSDDDDSTSSDSDDFSCGELEHYSDCRTSCSEVHSELEGLDDFSDFDFDEANLPGEKIELVKPKEDFLDPAVANVPKEPDFVDKYIRYIKNPFSQQFQWGKGDNKKCQKINPHTKSKQVPIKRKDDVEIIYSYKDKNKASGTVTTKKQPHPSNFIEKVDTKVIKTTKESKAPPRPSKSKFDISSFVLPGIRINMDCTTSPNVANLEKRNRLTKNKPGRESFDVFAPPRKPKNAIKEAAKLKNRSDFYSFTSLFPTDTKKSVDTASVKGKVATMNKRISSTHLKNPSETSLRKHAKELESILADGVDFHNVNQANIKVEEPPIFMNDELSFLFNDSRFETIIENSEDFANEVKTEYTNEWDELNVSNIKIKSELKKTGRVVYDKNKPATQRLAKEIKELERLAEVFTKEKTQGKARTKDSRRVKHVASSKMKDAKVINPLSVVKNIERSEHSGNPKRLTKRVDIKVEKDAEPETPIKKENRKTPKEKSVTKKEEAFFKNVEPIKYFKPDPYSPPKGLGKIRAVVKPFHKTSHTDNSTSSIWEQKNPQKGQPPLITSTPFKPVGYAKILKNFWDTVPPATFKLSKSFSHYDFRRDRKNSDANPRVSKRTASVCGGSTSKKPVVSCADDPITIKTESDSDVSEIRAAPVVRKRGRPKGKRTCNMSKQESSMSASELTNKRKTRSSVKLSRDDNKTYLRNNEKKLVVRLERVKDIDVMCRRLKAPNTARSTRSSCRKRKGYRELLANAKRLKYV